MANFAYVAKSEDGTEVTGFQAGTTSDEVVDHLHRRGLIVLHVVESRTRDSGRQSSQFMALMTQGRVGTRDLSLFSSQFSTVLEAGVPLVRGLRSLASDTTNRTLSKALDDVATRLESGETLGGAMAAHPEAFNVMFVSMIRAGERAGTLDLLVGQLATYLERLDNIQTKVKSALSYPIFVLSFVLLAGAFLLLQVVPTFSKIYGDMGQKLPTLTRAMITASNLLRENILLFLAALVVLGFLATLGFRTDRGRLLRDRFVISVPIFGPIVRKAVMSRFTRTLSILVRSGLPIMESLTMVAGAVGNVVIARAVEDARGHLAAGAGVTEAFRRTGKFPEMVLQMMATGEEAGNMETMLQKTSDFYDRQVEAATQSLAQLIEPVMVVFVGAVIGVIVVSMFLPIFNLGDAIVKGGANL
jgi:type IV pilus assembly protein PilC